MALSSVDRALLALDKMRRRVEELESSAKSPIAIVGAACRFPRRVTTPDELWTDLASSTDAVTEVPADRWDAQVFSLLDPSAPSEGGRRYGAFLEHADLFDAAAFGISRREAERMDPQQRLFLEVTAEALDDAGLPSSRLAGSLTGVFVGVYNSDFRDISLQDPAAIDSHCVTGGCNAVVAGRVSYAFDFHGPSLSVDTACSSSLVAIHLACQSLRNRECDLALAGGVNLMLAPSATLLAGKLFALSPDGRCKTFDASANGFVRGEGCGVVALKRLSDAVRDGDVIRAVIRGSAVNQDGRSAGLTAPNVHAQEAAIRAALAMAGVQPSRLGYIEAHGSGTPLGDPIEIDALKAVYGAPRTDGSRCALGTVKTNLGHLEAAAGIAGLIKTMLCLERGQIPAHLHLRTLNPRISLDGTPFLISTSTADWPGPVAEARCAAVSSFGVSGTNAHLILEAAPNAAPVSASASGAHLIPLSARTPAALQALGERWRSLLSSRGDLAALARSAAGRKNMHDHRIALIGADASELIAAIDGIGARVAPRIAKRKIAFVFPGQGSQWLGMARGLAAGEPVFAEVLARADQAVRAVTGWSIIDELHADESISRLGETEFAQPVLFAVQIGLAALWRSWGIEPDALVGHSMGEVAAAYVAGALSLEDAARVMCVRSALVRRNRGKGGMALVELDVASAEAAIAQHAAVLSVAAVNGPRTVLLSGAIGPLEEVVRQIERRGVFARFVKVDYASHSPEMDAILPDLREKLAGISPRAGSLPIYSTLHDRALDGSSFDVSYWVDNLRKRVLFAPALERLARDGHEIFLELSPHPVIAPSIEETLKACRAPGIVLGSLRRDRDDRRSMLEALGAIFEYGHPIDAARTEPADVPFVRTPLVPWDHERMVIERSRGAGPRSHGGAHHPLWGGSTLLVSGARLYESELSSTRPSYLSEHHVAGAAVLPGAAYVELALLAARDRLGDRPVLIEKLSFVSPLALPEEGVVAVQAIAEWSQDAGAELTVASGSFVVHARARVSAADFSAEKADLSAIKERCSLERSSTQHLRELAARGLSYGPAFRGVERSWASEDEVFASIAWTSRAREEATHYVVHPAMLDACLQVLASALPEGEGTWVPASIGRIKFFERPDPSHSIVVHARLPRDNGLVSDTRPSHGARTVPGGTSSAPGGQEGDRLSGRVTIYREDGAVLVDLEDVTLARIDLSPADPLQRQDLIYQLTWQVEPLLPGASAAVGQWLILGDDGGRGRMLASLLSSRGANVRLISRADDLERALTGKIAGVVHLFDLDVPVDAAPPLAAILEAQALGVESALVVAKAVLAVRGDVPRLYFVTHGAQHASGGAGLGVAQAPLWGFGRTLGEEHPELRTTLIDLPATPDDGAIAALASELLANDNEAQLILDGTSRSVARLARSSFSPSRSPAASEGRFFALEIEKPGTLDELSLVQIAVAAPGPGEVEIQVHAAGLNFLDVLTALGVRPDRPAGAARLGGECAGVITRVGEGVVDFSVGDAVVAIADGAIASRVCTAAILVAPKPAHLSFAEAAVLPIAYLTAWHSLIDLGRIEAGEQVLIHAASGGVGLAAIEIARSRGASVFATAGSAEKRAFLASIGVEQIMDSRTLGFADQIRERTGGRGVDLVLNCLTGAAVERGLASLAPYGRFVEIAKKDIYEDRKIGLLPFQRNLSYFAVDLARMMVERPDRVGRLLREVISRIDRRELGALPVHSFAAADVIDAFRLMAEAKHIGKLAIEIHRQNPAIRRSADVRGTILITGGLGGIGIEVARRLVERGAQHLVLAGRRPPDARARAVIASLSSRASVDVEQIDVADEAAVTAWIARLVAGGFEIRGVVHAAAVLEDGVLANQDLSRLRRALRPKLDAAWNLHTATRALDLDFFVMFSSAASLLGSAAQAPYAAGNAFLDALALHRRALGLPATSISFGPWAEVGLAAADEKRGKRFAEMGMGSLSPEDGLRALEWFLSDAGPAHVAVLPLDVRQWLDANPRAATSSFWSLLRGEAAKPSGARSLIEALTAASGEARSLLVLQHIKEQLGRVLRLAPEKIGSSSTFGSLGLDSLTGLEVRNRLENSLGVRLPATLLWTQPTPVALAAHLLNELGLGEAAPAVEPVVSASDALAELPEDELTRQLAAELAALRGS